MIKYLTINQRVTLLAGLGSILEYFDFVIYGMMASYLSVVFFPPHNSTSAILHAFVVFAVGYLARPLGGTIIGMIGDQIGRKHAFVISTSLMACSTLLIGFLPSFETLGMTAVLLLILCRIVQGLSFGGELPGAITIVTEFSPSQHHGWKASLIIASTSLGALIANGILGLLTSYLSKDEILSWGWRLPFLGGGILGLVLLAVRKSIQETPIFKSLHREDKQRSSLLASLQNHKQSLLWGSALPMFMAALIITNLYFPYFIPKFFAFNISDVFLGTTFSLIFLIIVFPLIGKFADTFSKTRILQWTCVSYIVLSVPILFLLSTGKIVSLFIFLMIQQLYIGVFSSCVFPLLTQIFSPEVRYTGIALCYNLAWAGMATLPMLYTAALNLYETAWTVPFILSIFAAISLWATRDIQKCLLKREDRNKKQELATYDLAS